MFLAWFKFPRKVTLIEKKNNNTKTDNKSIKKKLYTKIRKTRREKNRTCKKTV